VPAFSGRQNKALLSAGEAIAASAPTKSQCLPVVDEYDRPMSSGASAPHVASNRSNRGLGRPFEPNANANRAVVVDAEADVARLL